MVSNLQKKLEELKDYQAYSDEWFQLSSKIELEKSSKDRKDFTKKVYKEFTCNPQQSSFWFCITETFKQILILFFDITFMKALFAIGVKIMKTLDLIAIVFQ